MMIEKVDGPESSMSPLVEQGSKGAAATTLPPKPLVPEKLIESEKSRTRQLRLLDKVADAFGWEHGDDYDSRMFPPDAWTKKYQQGWSETVHKFGSSIEPIWVTARQKVEKRLYEPFAFNNNWDHVRRHDPENMRLVDAIVEEYGLCFYWNQLANEEFRLSNPQDRTRLREKEDAIEAVRLHVGAHYTQLLRERGYSNSEAKKIIGGAVAGYMLAAQSATGNTPPSIWPPKTSCPDEMMHQIDTCAGRYM